MLFYYFIPLFFGIVIGAIALYLLSQLLSPPKPSVSAPRPYSETEVEALLSKNGYRLVEKQKKFPVTTLVDGKSHLGFTPTDYIVEKNKRGYIVEIATGAADPGEPILRRKLLEYSYVCRPDGILLLDLSSGQLHAVSFDLPPVDRDRFFPVVITSFILFLIVGIMGMFILLKLL
jgi:hypothetical protein